MTDAEPAPIASLEYDPPSARADERPKITGTITTVTAIRTNALMFSSHPRYRICPPPVTPRRCDVHGESSLAQGATGRSLHQETTTATPVIAEAETGDAKVNVLEPSASVAVESPRGVLEAPVNSSLAVFPTQPAATPVRFTVATL